MLGSKTFFVVGIILIAVGLVLQSGATGAVKAVKLSSKLVGAVSGSSPTAGTGPARSAETPAPGGSGLPWTRPCRGGADHRLSPKGATTPQSPKPRSAPAELPVGGPVDLPPRHALPVGRRTPLGHLEVPEGSGQPPVELAP